MSAAMNSIGARRVAAVGVDAVEVAALQRDISFVGDTFLDDVYSPAELDYCQGDVEKLASRFAVKEATLKALGTGIRQIGMRDIEVVTEASGQPYVVLSPEARQIARVKHLRQFRCSMTREAGLALAVVTAELIGSAEEEA